MRFVAGLVSALALLLVAGVAYLYSGTFNVAASSPHNAFERWVLTTAMKRSVAASARSVSAPPPFTDDMSRDGFEHYDQMCITCHGGPNMERSEVSRGLNPRPPDLSDSVKTWTPRELFWIIKHGVKMTGMPSFGATHSDQDVWSIVAFLEKLAGMSSTQYHQMKHEIGAEPHEHSTHR